MTELFTKEWKYRQKGNCEGKFVMVWCKPRILRDPRRKGCLHVDWWAKNKRMYWVLMHGLFLTCTKESLFIKHTGIHVIKILRSHVCSMKRKPLTWNVGSLSMVAYPHPCWSLAQSKLPHYDPPPPSPFGFPVPIPPTHLLTHKRH